jgi:uncharacterized protein YoxC
MKRITITVAALALAVAGCGANAEEESFKRDFNAAQQPLERLLTDVSGASTPDQMGKIADGLDETATKMRALDPPADAKDELDTFVKEVDASADVMRDAEKAMEGKDIDKMTAALKDLQERMTAVGAAQQALATAVNG